MRGTHQIMAALAAARFNSVKMSYTPNSNAINAIIQLELNAYSTQRKRLMPLLVEFEVVEGSDVSNSGSDRGN